MIRISRNAIVLTSNVTVGLVTLIENAEVIYLLAYSLSILQHLLTHYMRIQQSIVFSFSSD